MVRSLALARPYATNFTLSAAWGSLKEIVVDVVKKYLEKLGASATVDHVDVRKGGFH